MKKIYGRTRGTRKHNVTVDFNSEGWVHAHTWSVINPKNRNQHMRLTLEEARILRIALNEFLRDYGAFDREQVRMTG